MKIDISNAENCCGCTACESICNHNAIQMEPDLLGFLYPKIDNSRCIDCGLCHNVCKFQNEYQPLDAFESPLVYGVRHAKEKELLKSQSGGAFWAFAEHFINEGFVIYGVGYDHKLQVVHKRAETKTECEELRGSKYTQSDLRGIFKEIRIKLQAFEKIVFIGTPCQVAGLKSFLPLKLQNNLFTIDLVCHAVPSPKIWEEYKKWIENRYKTKIIATDFRNKKNGWHSHFESFKLEKQNKEITRFTFRTLFYDHLSVRKSCTNCKFTNLKRPGDITIGDFWGWEEHHPEWNDNKGVSLLLINTEKGLHNFDQIDGKLLISIKSDTLECLQPQLKSPIKKNSNQELFIEEFSKYGFEFVAKKYADLGLKFKLKQQISLFLRFIRKIFRITKK